MELNDERIAVLADKALGYAVTWGGERAEAHVAAKVAEVRARFTQDGMDLTPAEALEKVEEQARQQWDRDAAKDGATVDVELASAAAIIADRIASAKVLPANLEPLVSQTARQTEELIALLTEDKFRARFERQTRQQALDAYDAADENTQAGRRLIAWLEASWGSTPFRADPEHDAIAVSRLQAAIEARQVKRVPAQLLEWHGKVQRARAHAGFVSTLQHLRSGRGIARKPAPLRVAI